ncbi:hypothetical protein WJX77_002923, partial [Trebouxia sp. C0004]
MQESQIPYGYMMTDEQLWLAYVELQEGCMYLSDAIPMRFQAGRPTVPMALLWLASQHTIKLKQLPRSGALPPSGPFTQFRAFLPSLFGRSWAPKDGAQDRLMIPVLRQVAQPDDPKPGMIYAKPEQTSHSYPLLEFDPHSKPIGRGTSGTMWQGLVFGQCAAVKGWIQSDDEEKPVYWLATSMEGPALSSLQPLKDAIMEAAKQALVEFHASGAEHNNLRWDNIVLKADASSNVGKARCLLVDHGRATWDYKHRSAKVMQGALLLPENGNCLLLQHNCVNRVPNARRQRTAPFCSIGVHNNGSFAVRQKHVAPRCRLQTCAVATLEGTLKEPTDTDVLTHKHDIRNIAIIAHVDHGKTTLVDSMLKQSKVFRANQHTQERIMDSNDIERERGITILSKNTAVRYKGIKINIIDTPGHADFGGEVERVLNMCDGVLLLVDSVEGPMPQTRFVLRKSLALNKKVIVVVNKIDRDAARPDYVIDTTFELFCELGASDEQCDFPAVYASGVNGTAGLLPTGLADDLEPLFEAIVKEIQPPAVKLNSPLQMLVTNLDYDDHKGRIAIGRVSSGCISKAEQVSYLKPGGEKPKTGKIAELFVYDNFNRVPAERVEAGDICAFTGLGDVGIGETVCARDSPIALPTIE